MWGIYFRTACTNENGSYVLSNGIVVLVYEDLQAYLRKELRFFATNSENA